MAYLLRVLSIFYSFTGSKQNSQQSLHQRQRRIRWPEKRCNGELSGYWRYKYKLLLISLDFSLINIYYQATSLKTQVASVI